jgi:pimeloyl-ACP methyl ester carboxylesterase
MNDLAEITKCFVEALRLNSFILIGHSMGGVVGLLYIQKYSSDIKAFINIEWGLTGADCNFSRSISLLDYTAFEKQYGKNDRGMYDYSHSLVDYSTNWNLLEWYIALKVPTVYIYGSESTISCIDSLSSSWCNLAKISKSGHHPFMTNPAEFYWVVSTFISKIH